MRVQFPTTLALLPAAAIQVQLVLAASEFVNVNLTSPLNWVAGTYLFPAEIIAGYNAAVDDSDYNATSWAEYILAQCQTYTACTSSLSLQGELPSPCLAAAAQVGVSLWIS